MTAQVDETIKSLTQIKTNRKWQSEPEVVHIDHVNPGNLDSEQLLAEQHVTACRLHGYRVGEAITQSPCIQVRFCKVTEEKINSDPTLAEIVQRVPDAQVIVILM